MPFDTWVSIIFPSELKTKYGARATDPDPAMSNATRYFIEGNVLRSHALAAQAAFDQALALVLAGEQPKVVTEAAWKKISSQATEPARRAKVRQYSERRRAADAESKRRKAEEREAAKAERNGHAEVTDEDLHDAAAEESLTLALAEETETHTTTQPGSGARR